MLNNSSKSTANIGAIKKVTETQRILKGTKKLPPLPSEIPAAKSRKDMQHSEQQNSSADSKRQDGVSRTRTNNKRRMAGRQVASTNSASPSTQKRSTTKSKAADSDSIESQPRTKPRKKAATKSKSQDKPVADDTTNGQEPMNADAKNSAQWTNIVKRVHMHRPQKNRGKHLKRKDASKRKKSEYVIENTWIPRDQHTSSNSKTLKKSKTKNMKTKETSKIRDGNDKISVEITSSEKEDLMTNAEQTESAEIQARNADAVVSNEAKESGTETPEVRESFPSPIVSSPIKLQHSDSSSKLSNRKVTYSPKLSSNRETTQVKQINVADFAKLKVEVTKSTDAAATNLDVADYRHRVSKVRFKGASNSVPNYNEKQESNKKIVAQNDLLLATINQSVQKKQVPIHVSKIGTKTPARASMFLLPTARTDGNHSMDLLGAGLGSPEPLPRLQYGSPTPLHDAHHGSDDEVCGEVSIVVPKLPQLHNPRTERRTVTPPDTDSKQDSEYTNTTPPTEEEPLVIVTNENGVSTARMSNEEREGWESGYNSMTPRLSIDSRSHAITPMSSFLAGNATLEIPNDPRSLTPFSTITSSTYLDHSRPQSTFLDVPHLSGGEIHETRRFSTDFKPTNYKLPAIYSRSDKCESADDRRYDFTPLPLQSIRTSDGELSD